QSGRCSSRGRPSGAGRAGRTSHVPELGDPGLDRRHTHGELERWIPGRSLPGGAPVTRRWRPDEGGSIALFFAVLFPALLVLAGLVADGGMALAAKAKASSDAREAARAGAERGLGRFERQVLVDHGRAAQLQ